MDGLCAYGLYVALKNHFTSDYDYFKYDKKIRSVEKSFDKRKDRFVFMRLGKAKGNYLEEFLVANFVENGRVYVSNLLTEECESVYKKWKQRQESMSYNFNNEVSFLEDLDSSEINNLFKTKRNEHPEIIRMFLQKEISIETLIILNDILTFMDDYDNILSDPLYDEVSRLCKKYRPFMAFDIERYKSALRNMVS